MRVVAGAAALAVLCISACAARLARPEPDRYGLPAGNAITFWGHACCYIDVDGTGIVTDPVFDTRLHARRRKRGAPPPAAWDAARIVLISHAHDDHLSPRTLAAFPDSALVLCPVPAADYLRRIQPRLAQRVCAMRPGETLNFGGGTVTAVPAHHPGGRFGTHAAADGRALGWILRTPQATVYVSGDTDDFAGMDSVGARWAPDIALLNINGHLHGQDAVRAARATRAHAIVPVHWGVYGYYVFPEQKQPRDSATLRRELGDALVVLPLGGSLRLDSRSGRLHQQVPR